MILAMPLALENFAYAEKSNRLDFSKAIVNPSVPKTRNLTVLPNLSRRAKVWNTVKNNKGTVAAVGATGAVAIGTASGAGILTALGTAGVLAAGATAAAGGVAALGATGGATFGAVPAGLLVGAVVGGTTAFVAYKMHQRYKNHLMGAPSEIVAELTEKAKLMKVSPDSLIDDYLRIRLDKVCKANGFDGGVNMKGIRTQRRKTNVKNSFLTAYNENGDPENYSYVRDYPSVIVRRLECIDTATDRVLNDPYLKEVKKGLELRASRSTERSQNFGLSGRNISGRQNKNLTDLVDTADSLSTNSRISGPASRAN
jgi:hypothetical protein